MKAATLRKGLLNTLISLIIGGAISGVAIYAHSITGLVTSLFMLLGFIVCATAYIHMRLYEREHNEWLEYEAIKTRGASESLFEVAEDIFPARQTRQNFEKYFVPIVCVVLLLIEFGGGYWLLGKIGSDQPSEAKQATVAMALNGLFALLLYEFGKYSAVYARIEKEWLLRPQASYLLIGGFFSLITAIVEVAGWSGYPYIDKIAAKILVVFVVLVGIENLITLVFEIYRPRTKVQEPRALYESRLIGMLTEPWSFFRTLAQAIDYQFGWKVSETWFYQFIERSIGWVILAQVVALELSTCFVVLEPGEAALLERFGKINSEKGVLGPGLHIKFPWPIDRIYRYETELAQEFLLGRVQTKQQREERVLLWTRVHAEQEFNMLVASREQLAQQQAETVPVNLVSVAIPIHYRICNLTNFAYKHVNGERLLQAIANRELTKYLVSVDFYDIMGPGRAKAAEELKKRIQLKADEVELGIEILFVGLHGIHPPVAIAENFEEVIGAIHDAAATNHYARAYAAEKIPISQAQGAEITNRASAAMTRLVSLARATSTQFQEQLLAYESAPTIYVLYKYLDKIAEGMTSARKYIIVSSNTDQVIQLDLQDKIRPDLLDVTLPREERR